jgi:hypothetical protein
MNSKYGVYSYTQEAATCVFKTAQTQEWPVDLIDSGTLLQPIACNWRVQSIRFHMYSFGETCIIDPISVNAVCVVQEEHYCILDFRYFQVLKSNSKALLTSYKFLFHVTFHYSCNIFSSLSSLSSLSTSHCIRLYKCRYNTRHLCFCTHFCASCN